MSMLAILFFDVRLVSKILLLMSLLGVVVTDKAARYYTDTKFGRHVSEI